MNVAQAKLDLIKSEDVNMDEYEVSTGPSLDGPEMSKHTSIPVLGDTISCRKVRKLLRCLVWTKRVV